MIIFPVRGQTEPNSIYIYMAIVTWLNGTSDDYNIQVLIYNKNTTKF